MAKKLLEEATVRRFMKIAGLQPLSEGFVDNLEESEELEEGEELEESAELEEGEELEENTELEEGADLEEKKHKKDEKDKKDKKEKMEENLEEMYKEEEPGMEDAEAESAPEPEMSGDEEVEMDSPPEEMGDEDKPDSDVQGRIMDVIKQLADLADLELEMEEEGSDDEPAPEPEDMGDEEVMEEGEHMEEPAEDPAGHKLDSAPKVDDADSKDPNQDPGFKPLSTVTKDMDGGKPVQESKDFREQLIEQVAKRVAAKLKSVK